jgi:hypothetical protein
MMRNIISIFARLENEAERRKQRMLIALQQGPWMCAKDLGLIFYSEMPELRNAPFRPRYFLSEPMTFSEHRNCVIYG